MLFENKLELHGPGLLICDEENQGLPSEWKHVLLW